MPPNVRGAGAASNNREGKTLVAASNSTEGRIFQAMVEAEGGRGPLAVVLNVVVGEGLQGEVHLVLVEGVVTSGHCRLAPGKRVHRYKGQLRQV